jgi:hypothetical protein
MWINTMSAIGLFINYCDVEPYKTLASEHEQKF